MPYDRYYTPQQVADRLQVCRLTIYRLIQAGKLSTIKLNRFVRISESSINQYLAQSKGI
jgi:excisionase family DNA binding protein